MDPAATSAVASSAVASSTVVQLSFGELIAVIVFVVGGILAMAKIIVAQTKAAIEAKQDALEESITGLKESVSQLEREVEQSNRQLPLEYVRREDWIRFSASIDAKLDSLAKMMIDMRGSK